MLISAYSVASVAFLVSTLAVAVWFDLDRHKIPNLLTLGAAATGLAMQTAFYGASGAFDAVSGLLTGLLALLPFYMAGGMAAGDVKLMAGVGAFMGPVNCLLAVGVTLLAGGLMGIVTLLMRGGGSAYFSRYATMLRFFSATGQLGYTPPRTNEAAASRFPYALAIASGTLISLAWTQQW